MTWREGVLEPGPLVVDLGFLKLPAEVHIDGLPLREDVEGRVTGLPMAVTGLLGPSERKLDLCADGGRVHVEDPGEEVTHRDEGSVEDRKSTRLNSSHLVISYA